MSEDGPHTSWAGQLETVLSVRPGDETERAVLACWASAFRGRARAYSWRHGEGLPVDMAVLIQPMLEPRCSGVMFTINPLTGSWREMTVEAAWGQAAPVVNGEVVRMLTWCGDHVGYQARSSASSRVRISRSSVMRFVLKLRCG